VIAWAAVDPAVGEIEHERGDVVVPAASTIKLFVYSAFRKSKLDPGDSAAVAPAGGSGVAVAAKSGELDSVRHEVALLRDADRRLVTAVCSAPPARPDELAAVAARRWRA